MMQLAHPGWGPFIRIGQGPLSQNVRNFHRLYFLLSITVIGHVSRKLFRQTMCIYLNQTMFVEDFVTDYSLQLIFGI